MDIENPAAPVKRGKGEKREKKEKPKKTSPAETGEAASKKVKKKRRGKGLIIMLGALVLALLITAVYVIIHFNIQGCRDALISAVNRLDPIYVENAIRINDLEERSREVILGEKAMESAKRELEGRIAEVERREQQAQAQTGAGARTPIYRPPISAALLEDLQNLAKVYAAMDPADAAVVLATLYNLEDMAAILYYMKPAAAAAILTQMDVRLAAQITEELLRQ